MATKIQRKQIKLIERTISKIAHQHGFDTKCTPVNGCQVLIEHSYKNKRGYPQTKSITIDPSISIRELRNKMLGDKEKVGFFF